MLSTILSNGSIVNRSKLMVDYGTRCQIRCQTLFVSEVPSDSIHQIFSIEHLNKQELLILLTGDRICLSNLHRFLRKEQSLFQALLISLPIQFILLDIADMLEQ